MKTRFFLPIALIVLSMTLGRAQNYKVAHIDSVGEVKDGYGKVVGSITIEGTVRNTLGVKMAFIDKGLELVEVKGGRKMGLTKWNGDFTPYYLGSPISPWTMSSASNGVCFLKDSKHNVIAEVNETYKKFGACAVHFFDDQAKYDEAKAKKKQ